jgi:hypothetical protein
MIKAGLKHINDLALLENVIWAEELYTRHRESLNTVPELADSNEIAQAFAPANEKLFALLPETMGKIEIYIRARPEEFVVLTE